MLAAEAWDRRMQPKKQEKSSVYLQRKQGVEAESYMHSAAEETEKQRVLAAEAGDRRTGVQPKQTGKSGVYLQREQGIKKGRAAEETEKQYVFAVAEKSRAAGAGLTD